MRARPHFPLNDLAGLFTVAAVGLSMTWIPPRLPWLGWSALVAFALLLVAYDRVQPRMRHAATLILLAMPLLALLLLTQTPRLGTAQVLLVVWAVMMVMALPLRAAVAGVLLADAAAYGIVRAQGHEAPGVVTLLYVGFQGFGLLTAHYARQAEAARARLALLNADLLATRALLADSARDGERLRMARELHDVAGHKLTAMRLNLRALATDPALAGHDGIHVAERLSAELLTDLRGVVQALRDGRGLDLETAIRALAAPLPRPLLDLQVADDVHVGNPAVAEALLRLVQEALTNAARHAGARTLRVDLRREGDRLHLAIEDDGHMSGALREGNGIAGMRERVAALHGDLRFDRSPQGALRIAATVPA